MYLGTGEPPVAYLHDIELRDMSRRNEDGIGLAAVLHLDTDLGVADHNLALGVLLPQLQ